MNALKHHTYLWAIIQKLPLRNSIDDSKDFLWTRVVAVSYLVTRLWYGVVVQPCISHLVKSYSYRLQVAFVTRNHITWIPTLKPSYY